MPIYEYECRKCGHRFETLQSFSDKPIRRCQLCGGRVDKLMSPAAVIYKGSGFYTTDYARAGGNGDGKKPLAADRKAKTEDKEPAKPSADD